jgi:riboflavin synthase
LKDMFTGLVEGVGRVAAITRESTNIRISISTPLAAELAAGDSLAVNGVCLTVVLSDGKQVHADIGPETATITTLGSLREGQALNLERPMRADGRFGGHFVQGHVDGTGALHDIQDDGEAHWLTITFPRPLSPYLIPKGSIAVDGISLTLARLADARFDVMIIPFTWDHTNVSGLRPGDRVNLECDLIGKYVARAAEVAGLHS